MSDDQFPDLGEGEVYRAKAMSWKHIYHTRKCSKVQKMDSPKIVKKTYVDDHVDARECAECAGRSTPSEPATSDGPEILTQVRMQSIKDELAVCGTAGTGELADRLNCSGATVRRAARYLVEAGTIERVGGGREHRWRLASADRGVIADD